MTPPVWHCHSVFETAGQAAQCLERALLQMPACLFLLYLWWLMTDLSTSRSFCCFAGFWAGWKAGPDAVFWCSLTGSSSAEDPSSLVPQTAVASPVPNHAECIQVMGFAVAAGTAAHGWGSSRSESACSMWRGCAPVYSLSTTAANIHL